jgi:ribose-phosphate pyrophosphokinase
LANYYKDTVIQFQRRIIAAIMRNTLIFAGSSCPGLTTKICENLGMVSAPVELTQFSNGGSATKITAVLPYLPYSRQSKKKTHRGAITARLLANLLSVAGAQHIISVDLHASQMQGFFRCPIDNLNAEPLLARWIRQNVQDWREGVVVSKNAGGTKRVTSLADVLKLSFGIITTDRRRGTMAPRVSPRGGHGTCDNPTASERESSLTKPEQSTVYIGHDTEDNTEATNVDLSSMISEVSAMSVGVDQHDDHLVHEVTHGRLIQGRIVDESFASSGPSSDITRRDEDHPATSRASSFFVAQAESFGGSDDAGAVSDEEDVLQDPRVEQMITLVGDVKNRPVFIVDDMIDKPQSWIAAAETAMKRGFAKRVYCMATHGVFGGDCLSQLNSCESIHTIIVTNSIPVEATSMVDTSKLVILDLSFLLSEAIRRNHYGESISPLFQHINS